MRADSRIRRIVYFLLLSAAFVVSTYAVSNLMPLLIHAARSGLSVLDAVWITGDLFLVAISVAFLARAIYRLDKKAGRIRNRVGWFE
jgi:hypothetical protein